MVFILSNKFFKTNGNLSRYVVTTMQKQDLFSDVKQTFWSRQSSS